MAARTRTSLSITAILADGATPSSNAARFAVEAANPLLEKVRLSTMLAGIGSEYSGRLRVRVDSIAETTASLSAAITGASLAAAEIITFRLPDRSVVTITAVASGADVTLGQFNISGTDATAATNLANCINGYAPLSKWITATTSTGTLIMTSKEGGSAGNDIHVTDGTGALGTTGSFSGGYDAGRTSRGTMTVTNNANLTNTTDTFTVGSVVFTWKTSASTQSEVTIGADVTASAANMVTKINAHTSLTGLVSATSALGVVTIEWLGDAATGNLLYLAVSDATAMSVTAMSAGTTVSNTQATRSYNLGAPA